MSDNPYQAPSAVVKDSLVEVIVPAEVLKKIRNAWVAAVISGSLTLVVTLFAIYGHSILGFSAWELTDVALIFGLAFGIYKKSRTCAVLMLVYFISAKILIIMETGKPSGLIMAMVFIYYFWLGVAGSFEYHKIIKTKN